MRSSRCPVIKLVLSWMMIYCPGSLAKNATGWGIDTLEVDKSTIEISPAEIVCSANAQYAGDQDEDSGPAGTTISGTVTIRILPDLTVRIEDEEFEIDDASSDDDW
jgi:hypothetical protein